MHVYLEIAIRCIIIYLFLILLFRVFGKREMTQLSIADLILIILISNAVQNAMVGDDSSIYGGIVAAAVLFFLNKILSYLLFRYKNIRKFIQSEPIMLIYNGKYIRNNIDKVMITEEELEQVLREHGINNIHDVSLSMLETDGNISIISGKDEQLKKSKHNRKSNTKKTDSTTTS
ncbi:MAG: DUF421 domain-containing protein [Chitinophagales bacterium]|nr:DUF421 domain-containing protein [Bacteroidota bacterium]